MKQKVGVTEEQMNLPVTEDDYVIIAGIPYAIELTDKCIEPYMGNILGEICYSEQKLLLSTSQGFNQQQRTFLHEVVHGLVELYHLPFPKDHDAMEDAVDLTATALYQFLMDNPELILRYFYGLQQEDEAEDAAESTTDAC